MAMIEHPPGDETQCGWRDWTASPGLGGPHAGMAFDRVATVVHQGGQRNGCQATE